MWTCDGGNEQLFTSAPGGAEAVHSIVEEAVRPKRFSLYFDILN